MTTQKSKVKEVIIGNSDKDADWLKQIGKYREEELAIHDKLAKENKDKKNKK